MAETQEIIQREAPEIEALKLGLLQSAKDLADLRNKPLTLLLKGSRLRPEISYEVPANAPAPVVKK